MLRYKGGLPPFASRSTNAAVRQHPIVTIEISNERQASGVLLRVLIVEDDAANLEMLRHFLHDLATLVVEAGNGMDAISLLKSTKFDIILMDVLLPDIEGTEVTKRLRFGEIGLLNKTTPVVAITAGAFPNQRDACLSSGMNAYMTKPIHLLALLDELVRWTSQDVALGCLPRKADSA